MGRGKGGKSKGKSKGKGAGGKRGSSARKPAAPPPKDALDLLPRVVWLLIAPLAGTLEDLWALTATCKALHGLRKEPQLVAWRELRVEAVKRVLQCSVWIRALRCDNAAWTNTDKLMEEVGMPPFPRTTLQPFMYPYAVHNMHSAIRKRPALAALMGPERCAAMVTEADREAVRRFNAQDSMWTAFLSGQGVLEEDDSRGACSWVAWAVDELEQVVKLVAERGLPLSTKVCRFWNIPEPYSSFGHNQQLKCDQEDVQPLWAWLLEQQRELGPPFVRTMLERFGPAVGVRWEDFQSSSEEEEEQ